MYDAAGGVAWMDVRRRLGSNMKKKARKLTPIEVARKGANASPWKNKPGCPTSRAAAIFKENQRTPHPSKRK